MAPTWQTPREPVQLRTVRLEERRTRARRIATIAAGATLVAAVAVGGMWFVRSAARSAASGPSGPAAASVAASSGATAATPSTVSTPATSPAPATTGPAGTSSVAESSAVGGSVIIGWAGDTTPGSKYGKPPNKGKALFEPTRSLLEEPDIMVLNLEGTYGKGGPSKCDGRDSSQCYAFQAPVSYAAALPWAGVDVVNLANNHSNDYLSKGLKSTKKALEDNDVAYTGVGDAIAYRDVDGVTVGFVGFAPYPWSPDIGDMDEVRELVKQADEQADIVVVLMHAGAEGSDKTATPRGTERAFGEFRGNPRKFAHTAIDAGADLVLGSGPHVVRGVERYKDRLIAYSLGNFAGWGNFNTSGRLGLSGLLTVRVAPDGTVESGRWRSLEIRGEGVPHKDSDKRSLKLVKKLSEQDFATPVEFDSNGEFTF